MKMTFEEILVKTIKHNCRMARHKDAISFDHCCSKMDGLSWSNQTGCYSCMQLKDISGKLTVTVRFVDVFISADTINKTYSKCK